MSLRDATVRDLSPVITLASVAHSRSPFADRPLDLMLLKRQFVVACSTPGYFAKVVENEGRVVGCLVGVITPTAAGVRVASDLLNVAERGTEVLIRDFSTWAAEKGADFVQIMDLTDNNRYAKLINRLGLKQSGVAYLKAV